MSMICNHPLHPDGCRCGYFETINRAPPRARDAYMYGFKSAFRPGGDVSESTLEHKEPLSPGETSAYSVGHMDGMRAMGARMRIACTSVAVDWALREGLPEHQRVSLKAALEGATP